MAALVATSIFAVGAWVEDAVITGSSSVSDTSDDTAPAGSASITAGSMSVEAVGANVSIAAWSADRGSDVAAVPFSFTTGRVGSFVPAEPVVVQLDGEVQLQWDDVTEWYRVLASDEIEHGYTIHAPLHDGNTLTISVDVADAEVVADGVDLMLERDGAPPVWYRKLQVFDATGRTLPSAMSAGSASIEFTVDTTGAVYPITVDPVLSAFQVVRGQTVSPDLALTAAANSAAVGGAGGSPAASPCPAGYLMTGHILYEYVEIGEFLAVLGVRARCRQTSVVGSSISLTGAAINVALMGTTSINARERNCAAGSVVIGFSGRSGLHVDQVALTCAPLLADGTLGSPTTLQADGNPFGGAPFTPPTCLPGVATGYYGRTGASFDQLGLQCASIGPGTVAAYGFGSAVDVVGNRMVVSAPTANEGASGAGLVQVLERPDAGSPWGVSASIVSPSPEVGGGFGDAVALSPDGTRIAVGESDRLGDLAEPGRVFLFEFVGGVWTQLGGSVAVAPAAGPDGFGASLAWVDNSRLVIGAPFAGGTGAVYDYLVGGALAPIGLPVGLVNADDEFGFSVAVDQRSQGGVRLVVGAPGTEDSGLVDNGGAVFIFETAGVAAFSWQRKFSGYPPGSRTGTAVDVFRDRFVVGSVGAQTAADTLTVRLSETSNLGADWNDVTISSAPLGTTITSAPNSYLAIEGDTVIVGRPTGAGQVDLYQHNGVTWSATPVPLTPTGIDPGDLFGWAVAFDQNTLVSGAPGDDGATNTTPEAGAIYALEFNDSAQLIVTNTNDSGSGSLRAAVAYANANPGFDVVTFDLPGPGPWTIPISSTIHVTDTTEINGASVGLYPQVRIDASGTGGNGLRLSGAGSSLRNLAIAGAPDSNIVIDAVAGPAPLDRVSMNRVFVGTLDGLTAFATSNTGIFAASRVVLTDVTVGGNDVGIDLVTGAEDSTVWLSWIGNTQDRVTIPNDTGIRVGSSDAYITANIIAGNTGDGVAVLAGTANLVEGNEIGTNFWSDVVGNGGNGIVVSSSNNVIDENNILHNGRNGIWVNNPAATGNEFTRNAINDNGELGISLGGPAAGPVSPTPNDISNNDVQSWPVLATAGRAGNRVFFTGNLDTQGVPTDQFVLQPFLGDACDASGNGEGTRFSGVANGTVYNGTDLVGGRLDLAGFAGSSDLTETVLTATVTRYNGGIPTLNTSEFSNCIDIVSVAQPDAAVTGLNTLATIDVFANDLPTPGFTPLMPSHTPAVSWDGAGPAPATASCINGTCDFTASAVGTYTFNPQYTVGGGLVSSTTTIGVLGAPGAIVATSLESTVGAAFSPAHGWSVDAGWAVALADIPVDRLSAAAEAIAGTPLSAINLGQSPLQDIPLSEISLSELGAPFDPVLSDVSITGGWRVLLNGTPLANFPLQGIRLSEAFAVIPEERLVGLTLSDIDPGRSTLGSLDVATLLLGDTTPAAGSTLAATPLGAIPLGAIPLGAIPLGAIPLGAIPLGAIGLEAAPLGAIGDLAAAPLGAIPLGAIPLGAITLGAIDLSVSPLGAIPLGAIPLGAIPLGAINLGLAGGDFCADLHDIDATIGAGQTCAALGIDPATTSVLEYAMLLGADGLAATPLGAIPLGAIPLGAIPLGAINISGIPLGAIPLGAIDLQASPLGAIPLEDIGGCIDALGAAACDDTRLSDYLLGTGQATLATTPLGAIDIASLPLGAIPLGAIDLGAIQIAGVPLGAIPLGAIDLQASALGAIEINGIQVRSLPPGAIELLTLGSLFDNLSDPQANLVVADILEHLTLEFLGKAEGFGNLSVGRVLLGLLLASDFPWEDMPLNQIETRDVACGEFDLDFNWCLGSVGSSPAPNERNTLAPENVALRVQFEVLDNPVTDAVLHLTLDGAIPAPGSAVLYPPAGGAVEFLDEPLGSGTTWRYLLPDLQPGNHELDLSVLPGLALGEHTFSVEIRSSGGDVSFGSGNYFVVAPDRSTTTTEPIDVQVDTLYIGYIDEPGATDWYEVPSPGGGGFRVAVYLSNLAGDVDTFVYRPSTAPISGDDTQRTIPLASSPVEDSGIASTGIGGTTLSPEILADSGVDETLTIAASSTNRGRASEAAVFFSRVDEPSYKIQITGFDQATSQTPYVLRVKYEPVVTPSSCPAVALPAIGTGAAPVIPAGATTLFLTNPQRMSHLYGSDAQSAVAADLAELLSATVSGQPLVNGALVDIAGIPGVANAFGQWDLAPCEPERANRVAGLVQQWIQATVKDNPRLRHVAIIGSDDVIPFARLADSTVIANESTYVEDFTPGTALHGAHSNRTYLSDAPYGDLDPVPWLDRYAYLPDLGVGRLVETPQQIRGAIQTFIDYDGVLAPETAAVAGYDFLTDGAERLKKNLVGVDDLDPDGYLLTETWTRADLIARAYNVDGSAPDIISPNAHFDHYRSLPALGNLTKDESDLFTIDHVDEITGGGVDLTRRIIFTMGCHAGLNVPDGTAVDPELDRDWAEVYTAERAIFVGNTGYGYGDTATVALTEQLMANFAFYLDGNRTIGQALSQAKQDQFGRAGLYGVYDLKTIEQATLYGLPMWQIDGPGRPKGRSPIGVRSREPVTGLQAASFSVEPTFQQESTPIGTYWSADGDTQFLHYRPIQPKVSVDVSQDEVVATGVLLTDIDSVDYSVVDAAFARPMTVSGSDREAEIESDDIIFPATFVTLGTSADINPGEGEPTLLTQSANIIPGQFIGPEGVAQRQRIFTKTTALVYYVDEVDVDSIDWTPPVITRVNAEAWDGVATFEVETNDPQSGVSRVLVLYRYAIDEGKSDWQAIDLTPQAADNTWAGAGTFDISVSPPLDYMVQSVNGDGVVGVSTYKGEFHSTDVLTEPPSDPPPVVLNPTCNGAPCSPAPYAEPVTIEAPDALISINDGLLLPSPVTITDDGHHLVFVEKNGSTATFSIEIRIPNPQIQVLKSTDDEAYSTVDQVLTYSIDVANTGNVRLTDVDVTDLAADWGLVDCGVFDGALEPEDTITCTATITVKPADIVAGSIINIAEASAQAPSGATVSDDDAVTLRFVTFTEQPTTNVIVAAGQANPTNSSPVMFTVSFSQPVTGFDDPATDLIIGGSANPGSAVISPLNAATYSVALTGMSGVGTATLSVPPGAAVNSSLQSNVASGVATVVFDQQGPVATIGLHPDQTATTSGAPIRFRITFDEPIDPSSFTASDLQVAGTSGATAALLSNDGPSNMSFTATIGSVPSPGTVTLTLPAGTVTDIVGNPNVASVVVTGTVTVNDTTPPVIQVPPLGIKVDAEPGKPGAIVFYTVSVLDPPSTGAAAPNNGPLPLFGTALVPTCTPASGSFFLIGSTPVFCSATDSSGNTATATFAVVVADTERPVLVPTDQTVDLAPGATSGPVDYIPPGATDNSGVVTVTCDPPPGAVFSIGITVVSCTASDPSGNFATTTFTLDARYVPPVNLPPTGYAPDHPLRLALILLFLGLAVHLANRRSCQRTVRE